MKTQTTVHCAGADYTTRPPDRRHGPGRIAGALQCAVGLRWFDRSRVLLAVGLALLPSTTWGQSSSTSASLSPDRVTFYSEPNFKGESLIVEAGASVENLERMTRPSRQPWGNAISSILVEGSARATIYSGAGFSGDKLDVTASITDLYGESRGRTAGPNWDRSILSVAVTSPQRSTASTPAASLPTPPSSPYPSQAIPVERPPTIVVVPPPPPPPRTVIIQPPRPRLDRRTAELIVQRAFREVLDRPPDPEGLRTYRDRLMYEGWTERQVIEQLQRSPEARSIKADEAITRIYREVLGRDPDPNGLAHYRAKWRQGWTQGQIRDDLRRSHEGRDGRIREIITRAYREVLGRDPDPAGYENYARLMRERGYTERDIRRALMSGDEYRQRKRR